MARTEKRRSGTARYGSKLMPDTRRARCKDCGGHRDDVGALSWLGFCIECGNRRRNENATQLHTMTGPAVTRWRRGMAASVGAVLVDDLDLDG